MNQMSRFLNRPQPVDCEVCELSECLIYDFGEEGYYGVVIFPDDVDAVAKLDIPVGHAPFRTVDGGFEVSRRLDGFAPARVESCFRDRWVYSDGSRSKPSDWKIGNGE